MQSYQCLYCSLVLNGNFLVIRKIRNIRKNDNFLNICFESCDFLNGFFSSYFYLVGFSAVRHNGVEFIGFNLQIHIALRNCKTCGLVEDF